IVLVYLGRAAGQAWEKVARYFDTYSTAALILFILLALAAVAWFVKNGFWNSKKSSFPVTGGGFSFYTASLNFCSASSNWASLSPSFSRRYLMASDQNSHFSAILRYFLCWGPL